MNIKNAYKQFNNTIALDAITISVSPNTTLGIAGHSGSGKSTLLRCIQKLETLDSGEIHYEGSSGLMFQDFQLFPHFSVLKNLTYAPLHTKTNKDKFKKTEIMDKAMHLLKKLDIADKAHIYPHSLSGGQKQRVALARCLMMDKNILLCDEPTSGLDLASIQDVVGLLKEVHDMQMTLLIASHDVHFLTQIAERIIVMKLGQIKADLMVAEHDNPIEILKGVLHAY